MGQLQRTIHEKLDPSDRSGPISRGLDLFLIALIAINVAAVILETVDSIETRFRMAFWVIEVISVAVFSVEYAARVWASPEDPEFRDRKHPRLAYMTSPLAIIDLVAILPFYLGFLVDMDLRFLRVLRLLRILKLTRYSPAMSMLLDVFREEANAFLAGFFILIVLLVLAASGAYLAEHQVQPEKFGSIPEAMWWAMATLTTVGYGDVVPITAAGQIFGSLVGVVGIGMAALPAGILASGLADLLRRRRAALTKQLRIALEDGVIDADEEQELEAMRRELGLSKRIAEEIRADVQKSRSDNLVGQCPHCGRNLN
ncbi:ion transporter [Denitrobaculum tricleocarpae]|uniref:Ion transporter n=1 Tax=Denitrobaculum tricleocarpae TaxID=2591009 RepID=A0A545SZ57_9PROT|nr:ion transporter [Denitrobaculum tricleocarpae]TQV70258.1 ion transporter [Denitrobaculum tricleocarpae]